ncbi:hypothetical protein Tco_0716738 [Tanacetum coccineum]
MQPIFCHGFAVQTGKLNGDPFCKKGTPDFILDSILDKVPMSEKKCSNRSHRAHQKKTIQVIELRLPYVPNIWNAIVLKPKTHMQFESFQQHRLYNGCLQYESVIAREKAHSLQVCHSLRGGTDSEPVFLQLIISIERIGPVFKMRPMFVNSVAVTASLINHTSGGTEVTNTTYDMNNSTASNSTSVSAFASNKGSSTKNGGDQVGIKEAPTSYTTKLRPTSLSKTNLWKLDPNVPNDADFDIWLPLASVHELCVVPNLDGHGYMKETIRVEYEVDKVKGGSSGADDDDFIEVKKKKSGGNNRGTKNFKPISVKPKTIYYPKVNQPTEEASPKTALSADKKKVSTTSNSSKKTGKMNASTSRNGTFSLSNSFKALNVDNTVTEEVDSGDKTSMFGVQEEGQSSTPLVEMINVFEQQLLAGKCVLLDDEGKPLEMIDYMVYSMIVRG